MMNDQDNRDDNGVDRRTVLTASLGLGAAGLVSGIGTAQGQSMTNASASTGEIWSQEYWAQKGNIKLNLWRKRVGAPRAGEQPKPILFLVHGSSNSTRSSYDLIMPPGKGEY